MRGNLGSRLRAAAGFLIILPVGWATVASAASVPRSAACVSAPAPGNSVLAMTVDATHRTTLLHVPPGLAAGQPTALVIALHGVGGSGPKMEPYSGFSTVADRHRFVVAYPSSAGSYWNSTADRRLPDDVRFLGRLITTIEAQECIDPGRTYLAGVSNGGGMAALAACQLATQVSAFASVAGGYDGQPPCRPRRPVSVLEVHGTADQIVPYFGRTRRPTRDRLPPFVNAWVSRDRCRGNPTATRLALRATAFRWSRCASGVRVAHIRVLHGRHQWPGATPPDPGPASTFCSACEIWRFFSGLGTGRRRW